MPRNYFDAWPTYISVSERRKAASKKIANMRKSGKAVSPVVLDGRTIASSFWGKAWCKNLESYSDYENRLPRGRSYVRSGAVIDLQVDARGVRALVSGTNIYKIRINFQSLAKELWERIKLQCSGKIGSMIELLKGTISKDVMSIVTNKENGLFPKTGEIDFSCSCPDWAWMCKHVAAVLYGVGARLDSQPELLFTLRGVDPSELIETVSLPISGKQSGKHRQLQRNDLSSLFGIDLADSDSETESLSALGADSVPPTLKNPPLAIPTTSKKSKRKPEVKLLGQSVTHEQPTSSKVVSKKAPTKTAAKQRASTKTKKSSAKPLQAKSTTAKPNKVKSATSKPNKAKSAPVKPIQAKSAALKPAKAKPTKAKAIAAKSGKSKPVSIKASKATSAKSTPVSNKASKATSATVKATKTKSATAKTVKPNLVGNQSKSKKTTTKPGSKTSKRNEPPATSTKRVKDAKATPAQPVRAKAPVSGKRSVGVESTKVVPDKPSVRKIAKKK
jgi:uncharacterized Zn finger protein